MEFGHDQERPFAMATRRLIAWWRKFTGRGVGET
jgi:hypothetical protein